MKQCSTQWVNTKKRFLCRLTTLGCDVLGTKRPGRRPRPWYGSGGAVQLSVFLKKIIRKKHSGLSTGSSSQRVLSVPMAADSFASARQWLVDASAVLVVAGAGMSYGLDLRGEQGWDDRVPPPANQPSAMVFNTVKYSRWPCHSKKLT